MNQKGKVLIKDIVIFGIGSIGSKLILFFLVPLYTNYLSTSEYGTSDLVVTISQLLVPFVSVVIFDAVFRFGLSKYENAESVLKCSLFIFMLGSIATLVISPLFLLYQTVSNYVVYIAVLTMFTMFHSILTAYLKVIDKNKIYALISIVQTLVLATMNIVLLICFRTSINGYLISNVISFVIPDIFLFVYLKVPSVVKNVKLDKRLLKEMLMYSAPLILNNVSWWVIHSSDKMMVEMMIGASALGIYTVAAKIPSLINVAISIFQQAWGISTIKEYESTEDTSFYTQVLRVYTLISFMATCVITFVIRPFMSIYVGSDFGDAWKYVPLLLQAACYNAFAIFYGSLYGALKKSKNNMLSTLIAAIVNIIVNYVLIIYVGVWGAVIGTFVAYLVLAIVRIIDVNRFIKIKFNWFSFIASSVVVLLQGVSMSLDFYPYIISTISVILLIIINIKTVKSFISIMANKFKRKKSK